MAAALLRYAAGSGAETTGVAVGADAFVSGAAVSAVAAGAGPATRSTYVRTQNTAR